jgi:SAM-dependent methyltransferase
MFRSRRLVTAVALFVGCVIWASAQAQPDRDAIWADFMTLFRAAPTAGNPVVRYAKKVQGDGVSKAEADRRVGILMVLLEERRDWVEILYDGVFNRPLEGIPHLDGFNSEPNRFLSEVAGGLTPGTALDAGMGQGRNAIYLARRGWDVTGYDLSGGAIAAAAANARAAGVRLTTVKAAHEDFDFGRHKWDLIVFAYAWAPVTDPAFVTRVRESLRPGGRVIFEHFIKDAAHQHPPFVRALEPGQLKTLFSDFLVDRYDESDGVGDWGGPGSRLVRMVAARK